MRGFHRLRFHTGLDVRREINRLTTRHQICFGALSDNVFYTKLSKGCRVYDKLVFSETKRGFLISES